MKLIVLAVGQRAPGWMSAGFAEYARRMPREMPLRLVEIRPEPRHTPNLSASQLERILRLEADRVRAATPPGALAVALDERGLSMTTAGLAQRMESWRQEGGDVAFLIGGADGLHPDLKQSAHLMLSLSAMTLPHHLVRVVLAEQLYRAVSILQGHPYHRA
jgi:23S rRNA (pseudouridine1915-N3)-methyltransferase